MANGDAQFWVHQFIASDGTPFQGVNVYHYAAGTTQLKDVWVDAGRSTLAEQPVRGDSSGTVWFYGDGTYRLRVVDANGALLYDWDSIRLTADTATMWEGDRGTAYPAATTANRGQLFALLDGANAIVELGINDDGTAFRGVPTRAPAVTFTNLPATATTHTGWLRRVTDRTRGLWMDTGTVWVSVSGETINAKEFGAKGDSTTDDTVAIQAALDALNTLGGGRLYFPLGTYIATQVTVGSNTWICGAGPGATIIRSTTATALDGIFVNKDRTNGNSNIIVSDLTTERTQNPNANFNSHIMFERCSHVWVTRCKIVGNATTTNGVGKGVLLRACNYAHITECYVVDVPDNALSISHGEGWTGFVGYAYILNNVIIQTFTSTASSIIPSASHCVVSGNYVKQPEGAGGQAVEMGDTGVTDVLITDNTFLGCQLLFGTGDDVRITNNLVGGSAADVDAKISIFPSGTNTVTNLVIEGNVVLGGVIGLTQNPGTTVSNFLVARNVVRNGPATSAGITIDTAVKGAVIGNYVHDCKQAGIRLSACTDVVIADNFVRACGTAPASGFDFGHQSGIWFVENPTRCQARSNFSSDNAGYGIIFQNAATDCDCVDNDVRGNSLGDIRFYNMGSTAPIRMLRASGAGSPAGAIFASPGSIWNRTDAATGISYVKNLGTDRAGWQSLNATAV